MKKIPVVLTALALVLASNSVSAGAAAEPAASFESLDTNHDSSVDKAEAAVDIDLSNAFSLVDSNKDNLISIEEYKAHKEQAMKEGQAAS